MKSACHAVLMLLFSLTLLVPACAQRAPAPTVVFDITGEILERGDGYLVLEGTAIPRVGLGQGEAARGLLVILEPDVASAPGPDTGYLGCGVFVPGLVTFGAALTGFRALPLSTCRR